MVDHAHESDATCAGKPIRAAMYPFSVDFLAGCEKFLELAGGSNNPQEIRVFNSSCVVNAACFLEAKINEEVATARICFDEGSPERRAWDHIKENERRLSVQEKWGLISAQTGGVAWDSGREPFQSFEIIASLRNELIHFKGELFGRDETPAKKISGLMQRLGIRSESTWIEDDCSSWVTDLLSEKCLTEWVVEKIKAFNDQYYALIHGRS